MNSVRDLKTAGRRLIHLLNEEMARISAQDNSLTISLSGGLDSTLIARLAKDILRVKGIVVGTSESVDIQNAKNAAIILDIDLQIVEINEDDLIMAVRDILKITRVLDPLFVSFETPTYLSLGNSKDRILMTGQGADELFGGYAKYRGISEEDFISMRRDDVIKVNDFTVLLENKLAAARDKTIIRPFLSKDLVVFAEKLDYGLIMPGHSNKMVVREALQQSGLDDLSRIAKKAAQYGSGVTPLLKKIARKRGRNLGGLMNEIWSEIE